jgi:hypothetical protein
MNPRAPQQKVHFGEVPSQGVRPAGFNLNAKLDIDPDFLKRRRRTATTTMTTPRP